MNTKIGVFTITALISTMVSCGAAFAGTTASISVSCSVPAIPGVNVPYAEQTSLREEARDTDQIVMEREARDGDQSRTILVKTYYSR